MTKAGIKGNTDAGHEGDGETTRHRCNTDAAWQHDVRASRDAAGTSSPAVKSSQTLRACQNTPRTAEELTKEIVLSTVGEQACGDARPSRIRLTYRESESHGTVRRLLETASSWRVQVAPPELMGGSSRTVLIEANLPDLGADRNGSRRNNDFCQHCSRCDMRRKADGECGKT